MGVVGQIFGACDFQTGDAVSFFRPHFREIFFAALLNASFKHTADSAPRKRLVRVT